MCIQITLRNASGQRVISNSLTRFHNHLSRCGFLFLLFLLFSCSACNLSLLKPNPSFPIFGGGPVFEDISTGEVQTSASLHAAWSVGSAMAGETICGEKCSWYFFAGWTALTLIDDGIYHRTPGWKTESFAPHLRTDLAGRILPGLTYQLTKHLIRRLIKW